MLNKCYLSKFETESSKPTCKNCKFVITENADEETKKWGVNIVYYCGKYENFVAGLPTSILIGVQRLSINENEYKFDCKYYKKNETCKNNNLNKGE